MIFWGAAFRIGKKLLRDMKKVYVKDYSKTKFQAERVKELDLE